MRFHPLLTASALALLFSSGPALRAQRPLQDQDILQYLTQTVTWYRDVATFTQSPAGSQQALIADSLRDSSTDVVRSAFEFARAQAAIPAVSIPDTDQPDDTRSRNLAQAAVAADQRAQQAQEEIEQINHQLQTAPDRSRAKLLALRDEVTSEMNFARARRDALRTLVGFLNAPEEGGLAAKISDLERSVPEAAAPNPKARTEPTPIPRIVAAPEFHAESAGIIGLTTEVFSLSQRMSRLDRLVEETDALRQTALKLRGPLRNALRDVIQRGNQVSQAPESSDLAALTAQRKELDKLLARFKQLSASSTPLSEQAAQIAASRGRMIEWRGSLSAGHNIALRYLLLRVGMLGLVLLVIFGFSELWRRATVRYVQDLRRRRQFLLLRRIVVGCGVVAFIILSFVTEFGSLATVAGLSAAGIALALQSVILSMVAYFFLVGRWGVRIGDRVTVSGVTGEVADIGLFRLYLMELGGSGLALQPTGRVVVFPNAVFFQPSAMFKQLPGIDYVWRTITVKLSGAADYAAVETQLLGIVQSVYAEYREVVERQHKNAQSALSLHTGTPHPESRLRFVDSGLEITIRYPVEIHRAAEIEDRITRELLKLSVAGGTLKIETPQ